MGCDCSTTFWGFQGGIFGQEGSLTAVRKCTFWKFNFSLEMDCWLQEQGQLAKTDPSSQNSSCVDCSAQDKDTKTHSQTKWKPKELKVCPLEPDGTSWLSSMAAAHATRGAGSLGLTWQWELLASSWKKTWGPDFKNTANQIWWTKQASKQEGNQARKEAKK